MGGSGSTRWLLHNPKRRVESGLTLSIFRIVGAIFPREAFDRREIKVGIITWTNTRTGERLADIWCTLLHNPTRLELHYTHTTVGGVRRSHAYAIHITSTPCNYGGVRYGFECPNCKRRVGKLYLSGSPGRFACRTCHNLTYASSQDERKYSGYIGMLAGVLDLYDRHDKLIKRRLQARGKRTEMLDHQLEKLERNLFALGRKAGIFED
jgi:hypothetical protein